jgi:cold-inducible RNA-binding protein
VLLCTAARNARRAPGQDSCSARLARTDHTDKAEQRITNCCTVTPAVGFWPVYFGLLAPQRRVSGGLRLSSASANESVGGASPTCFHNLSYEYPQVTKLYVGNLPFSATEDGVRALFSKHGSVEKVSLINDRDTGRPRGFGFVEMSQADASRALQELNGVDFEGRALKVSEAQDKPRSGGGGRGGGNRGGGGGRY